MVAGNKLLLLILFCATLLTASTTVTAHSRLPVAEEIIKKGFPFKPKELQNITTALYGEYEQQKNITSLIFYAYGMLKLANHFSAVNDVIKASEYAKLGFFYLDEAVEKYEKEPRVHYLRARVDAWLPASLGRCVIAEEDTQRLLQNSETFNAAILANINYMRYRALQSCQKFSQAESVLTQLKKTNPSLALPSLQTNEAPAWDVNEVMNIIMPLMGEK